MSDHYPPARPPATRLLFRHPTQFNFENHRVSVTPKYWVLPDISGDTIHFGSTWNSRDSRKYSPFFNTRPEPARYCKNIIVPICNINTLFISKCDSGHPPASQQLCWGWACRLEEFSGFDLFKEGLFQSFCPFKQGYFNILQYWKFCGCVYSA